MYKTRPSVPWASLVAQSVKNLPPVQETWVWSLGPEDPLEKEMATHSSILAWKILWTEERGGIQSMRSQESDIATKQGRSVPCMPLIRQTKQVNCVLTILSASLFFISSFFFFLGSVLKKEREAGNESQMILFYSLSNQKLPFKNGNYSDLNARSLSGKSNKNHSKIFVQNTKIL